MEMILYANREVKRILIMSERVAMNGDYFLLRLVLLIGTLRQIPNDGICA